MRQVDIGGQRPRRGGQSRSVLVLMATTFTAALAFVVLAVVIGGIVDPNKLTTIATVHGRLVAHLDAQLVDIDTELLGDEGRAAGTGMVLTPSGIVLTNNHVIQGAVNIQATDVGNGQTYAARVIGYDERRDVAVLQLANASGLATVTLGDSSGMRVGNRIVTIGNAGGAGGTPAARSGTVVGLDEAITVGDEIDRSTEHLNSLIEVNGDLQPGDSGGPMVSPGGTVVGMDTAASTSYEFSRNPTGEGFAIAIDAVKPVAQQIRALHGSGTIHIGPTAFIGVTISSGSATPAGAAVLSALVGTPAATAGLVGGDVITSLGGIAVRSATGLTEALVRFSPGDAVSLQWVDPQGLEHLQTITLASGPAG